MAFVPIAAILKFTILKAHDSQVQMRATSDRRHSGPLIQIKPHSPPGPVSRLGGGYAGKAKRARDLPQPVMQDRDDEQEDGSGS
jgi:hypothetical protein